jgi:hypothetical protein
MGSHKNIGFSFGLEYLHKNGSSEEFVGSLTGAS